MADRWAQWLLERRFGGDPEQLRRTLEHLRPVRDRVLDRARVRPGDVLLDVGAGDGLIGFGALERVGEAGLVVFSDVSQELLERCRELAAAAGQTGRCRFVLASATDLGAIASSSVDVVTTRSVLIYVEDKPAAFREFARVLRPGGRVSLFEPINRFAVERRPATELFGGYDGAPIAEIVAKVHDGYRAANRPGARAAMLDFDERDLLALAEGAGFRRLRLEYEAAIEPVPTSGGPLPWETFLRSSGNPNEPSVGEVVERVLDPEEARAFEAHFRPLVEGGIATGRWAVAYLGAEL